MPRQLGGNNWMRLPRKPIAVVFDMDGLLFDTETLYQEAIHLAAAEAGHEVRPGFFDRTLGLPWAQSRALLLSHFGEAFAVDEFQAACPSFLGDRRDPPCIEARGDRRRAV